MKKYLSLVLLVVTLLSIFSITDVYATSKKCKTIDGAYYDKNGKETDKGTYEKQCVKHTCELVADAYFGKDSKEVTREQYESECESLEVNDLPDTGSNIDIILVLLGISIITYSCLRISTIKEQ